jgi:hypothetical protein
MPLLYTKTLKILSVLLLLTLTSKAQADYLDTGLLGGEYAMLSKFYAKGFIFDAQASKTNRFGIGTGWQHKGAEVYLGIGYNKDTETGIDDIYTFSELVYRNGRHSIYDLGINYTDDKASAKLGFTYLIDENAGIIVKHDFTKNELFIGIRRWIR